MCCRQPQGPPSCKGVKEGFSSAVPRAQSHPGMKHWGAQVPVIAPPTTPTTHFSDTSPPWAQPCALYGRLRAKPITLPSSEHRRMPGPQKDGPLQHCIPGPSAPKGFGDPQEPLQSNADKWIGQTDSSRCGRSPAPCLVCPACLPCLPAGQRNTDQSMD
jgi:hypothetical protein